MDQNKTSRQVFAPGNLELALRPAAFGMPFDCAAGDANKLAGPLDVHIVEIRGPLMHRKDWWFDSYEDIKARVGAAIEAGARRVVLDIDSPGGLVSGAFEAAREIRSMAETAGVELVAFVDSQATSAGYAIASAASKIGVAETATIGSIGVIAPMYSMTERNKLEGIAVELVCSGDRKADGHPDNEIKADAIGALRKHVDALASIFVDLVVDHGWGGDVAAVRGMEAGVVHGAEAVALGLATEVTTLEKMLAYSADENGEAQMTMDEIKSALEEQAESEDEEMASKARAALAAMNDDDESEASDDEDEPEADDDEDEPEAGDDDEDDEPEAMAGGALAVAKLTAEVERLKRRDAARAKAAKMTALLATRPDLSKDLKKSLRALSVDEAKGIIAGIPEVDAVAQKAAASTVTGTQGDAKRGGRLSPEEQDDLDKKMGLKPHKMGVTKTATRLTFGVR